MLLMVKLAERCVFIGLLDAASGQLPSMWGTAVLSTCITSVAHLPVVSASVVVTREELRLFYFQQILQFSFFFYEDDFLSFFFFSANQDHKYRVFSFILGLVSTVTFSNLIILFPENYSSLKYLKKYILGYYI